MKKPFRTLIFLLFTSVIIFACSCSVPQVKKEIVVTTSLTGKDLLLGQYPVSFPLSNGSTTINVLASGFGTIKQEDVYVWKKYEEMTGVKVNWTTVKSSERAGAVATAFLNNQELDLIFRCKISASRLSRYGESGYIIDLAKDGLLEKYAPNCWSYLSTHPQALASITTPDGKIYSIPQINSGAELRVSRKIFINRKWLERVNMKLPTTTEEMYLLLKAFKEQDANGNGNSNDEIPFCPIDWQSVQDVFYGAFGLANRGIHNTTIDSDKNGRARFIPASDDYNLFLEYMNRLYSEELIDSRLFDMSSTQWANNAKNDLIGVFASTNLASVPSEMANDWVAVSEALEGPNGDKMWAAVRADYHSEGAAVIPATCTNPELVLRWLDYFWTDEGSLFYHMGIENETFVVKEDSTYDYAPKIYEQMNEKNKSFDEVVAEYSPYPGGGNPTVEIAPYFMGGEMATVPRNAAISLFEYAPEVFWPSFTFTDEENAELDSVRKDIDSYCATSRIAFITGEKPLSEWDAYTQELDRLNVSKIIINYQKAIVRYNKFIAENFQE